MITHSIRTSKYKTTIDIPAEKLQTKSKFIQISKAPPQQQQTILIPNSCYQHSRQKIQTNLQTKLVIQELQQAYNEDMRAYEEKIRKLQTSGQIQRLKLQNLVQYQRRQIEIYKLNSNQAEQKLNKATINFSSQINSLEMQAKNKEALINSKSNTIQQLQQKNRQLTRQNQQKSQLLSSRFRQFQIQKQKVYKQQRVTLTTKIENFKNQLQTMNNELQRSRQNNSNLQNRLKNYQEQSVSLKHEQSKLRQLNEFQSKQIEDYIKYIKELQNDKQKIYKENLYLQQQLQSQNVSIEQLIQQMKQQKMHIQRMQAGHENSQIDLVSKRLVDYQTIFAEKQKLLVEQKSLYLLKLQQIDQQRQLRKAAQSENLKSKQQVQRLTLQLAKTSQQREQLGKQLTKKILQYNQLLSRPPEEKLYEVRIQKTIQKKEYIQQLESKIQQLQKIIQKLRQENQTIVEEIKRSVIAQKQGRNRQKILQSSVQQLKNYIATQENRIAWSVSRQIAKDVEISRDNSQKSSGYKVFLKQHQSNSSNSQQVSDINKNEGINFSVESKIQRILQKRNQSSISNQSKSIQQ